MPLDEEDEVGPFEGGRSRRSSDFALLAIVERMGRQTSRLDSMEELLKRSDRERLIDCERRDKSEKQTADALATLATAMGQLQGKMDEIPNDRHRDEHDFVKTLVQRQKKEAEFWDAMRDEVKTQAIRWVGKAALWCLVIGLFVSLGSSSEQLEKVFSFLAKVLGFPG